jgi:acyl-CoA thioester hydrolase|tara:strand:+ start:734 stop:1114 length:381 start_codon:yes stop_codon:yes gene_type:complete
MNTSTIEIRVRYNECDPMGVAHHATYPIWFEMGRTEHLRSQGGLYGDIENAGLFFVVVDLHVQYKKSAKYDDVLSLTTIVEDCTPARLRHSYTLTKENEVIARASTTLACVNSKGVVHRFPESLVR